MAALFTVMDAIQSEVAATVAGLVPLPDVGQGWPPVNRLQQVGQGTAAPAITVWDRKVTKNTTRWSPIVANITPVGALLTTSVSRRWISASGTTTITLGGTIQAGDAVSAVVSRLAPGIAPGPTAAQVVSVIAGDTLALVAARLAAAINGDATLNLWVTAAAVGPVVTLTPVFVNGQVGVTSFAGNGGSQIREVGRREAGVQIVSWTRTVEQRNAITTPLSALFGALDVGFGVNLPDGTSIRLEYISDYDLEDNTLTDVYRHDFLLAAEYPVTVQDLLYAVLAPVPAFAINTPDGVPA